MNASDGAEQQTGMPSLCAAGCGFFSNIGTNGYCSKCWRDIQKAELESAKAQTSLAQALSPPQQQQQSQQQQSQQRHASPEAQPAPSSSSSAPAVAGPTASPSPAASAPACSSSPAAAAEAQQQQQQQEAQQPSSTGTTTASATPPAKPPSPTRCLVCNKKVGLTGFSCKCCPEAVFCSAHRIAEDHACTYDWKGVQRQQLAEKNPVVAGAKVEKL